MEPVSNQAKIQEFIKQFFTAVEESERQKQYQQLLFEAKIYDLTPFAKLKLLLNAGNEASLFGPIMN